MKTIHINGKDYIEKETVKGQYDCDNCALRNAKLCREVGELARDVFGGDCGEREVFYGVKGETA
jgi:hypothetical protein